MADYNASITWPIQFRGEFVRAVLAYVDALLVEAGFDENTCPEAAEPGAQLGFRIWGRCAPRSMAGTSHLSARCLAILA